MKQKGLDKETVPTKARIDKMTEQEAKALLLKLLGSKSQSYFSRSISQRPPMVGPIHCSWKNERNLSPVQKNCFIFAPGYWFLEGLAPQGIIWNTV